MTIKVKQECNGCKADRIMSVQGAHSREVTLATTVNDGGWREVAPNKHLCPACIRYALNSKDGDS